MYITQSNWLRLLSSPSHIVFFFFFFLFFFSEVIDFYFVMSTLITSCNDIILYYSALVSASVNETMTTLCTFWTSLSSLIPRLQPTFQWFVVWKCGCTASDGRQLGPWKPLHLSFHIYTTLLPGWYSAKILQFSLPSPPTPNPTHTHTKNNQLLQNTSFEERGYIHEKLAMT